MLDRPGDAHRHVELAGARSLAGLSDLAALRQPAGIGDRPRAAEHGTDRIGELAEALDVRLLADATSDRKDELGARHVDVVLARADLDEFPADEPCAGARRLEATHHRARAALRWLEHTGAQGEYDHRLAGKVQLDVDLLSIAAARGDKLPVLVRDPEDVGGEAVVTLDGERGGPAESVDAVGHEYDRRLARLDERERRGFERIRIEILRRHGHRDHLVDPRDTHLRDEAVGLIRKDRQRDALVRRAPQVVRCAHQLERYWPQRTKALFCNDKDSAHDAPPVRSLMSCARRAACSSMLPSI